MKTIEQRSAEIYNSNEFSFVKEDIEGLVRLGAEFAQRWIPVDEEKPEIDESILMKNSFGCYGVGKWDGKDWTFYTIEGVAKLSNWISEECTHWRPIEVK